MPRMGELNKFLPTTSTVMSDIIKSRQAQPTTEPLKARKLLISENEIVNRLTALNKLIIFILYR